MRPLPPQGSALSPELRARGRGSVAALELDLRGARAWPALEEERIGEWRLRFSRGVTGRANSVLPLGPDEGPPLEDRLDAVEAAYRARGLPPKFQITESAWPPGLVDALRRRTYVEDRPTFVMTACIGDARSTGVAHVPGTDVAPAWHPEWFEVYRAVDSRGEDDAARGIFERITLQTAYASRRDRDGIAAVGLAVLDDGWIGIYCIATLPRSRLRGHASAIVASLLAWGESRGARHAHLSAHSTNTQAQELYRSFGFETTQSYRYFTAG